MASFRMDATLEAQNNASSEIAALSAELGVLAAEFDRLDGRDVGVNVRADTLSAEEGIKDVEQAAVRVGALSPAVEVGVDADGALADMKAVDRAADRLDGRNIDIDVDVDSRGAERSLGRLGGAATGAAADVGGLVASIGTRGAAVGGRLGLAGGATLVGALVLAAAAASPAAAALATAGVAAAGLAAGAGLVALPLARAVGRLEDLKKEGKDLPPHLDRLDKALQGVRRTANDAFRGADKGAALLAAEVLDMTRGTLPLFGRASERSVGAMRHSFREVREEVGGSARDSLENILDRIPNSIRSGTSAVGRFAAGFLNFMEEGLPYAEDFLKYIDKTAGQFFRWSESDQGRRDIKRWMESAKEIADSLGDAVKEIGGALVRLGNNHSDTAAEGIDGLTYAISELIDEVDSTLTFLGKVEDTLNAIDRASRNAGLSIHNFFRQLAGLPERPYVGRAFGGDEPMTASQGIPGVPLYRASHGLDLPAHYVEGPTRLAMPGLDVLYGEALSAGHREYMFRDGGNLRFITEEPGYDANSFNLWRDLGERKGYLSGGGERGASGAGLQTRRRPPKQPLVNRIQINEKVLAEVVTDLVRQNLDSGGIGEEWGL